MCLSCVLAAPSPCGLKGDASCYRAICIAIDDYCIAIRIHTLHTQGGNDAQCQHPGLADCRHAGVTEAQGRGHPPLHLSLGTDRNIRSGVFGDAIEGFACALRRRSPCAINLTLDRGKRSRIAVMSLSAFFHRVAVFAADFGARAMVRQPQHVRSRGQTADVAALWS